MYSKASSLLSLREGNASTELLVAAVAAAGSMVCVTMDTAHCRKIYSGCLSGIYVNCYGGEAVVLNGLTYRCEVIHTVRNRDVTHIQSSVSTLISEHSNSKTGECEQIKHLTKQPLAVFVYG